MRGPLLEIAARALSMPPWLQQKSLSGGGLPSSGLSSDTTALPFMADEVPGGTPLSFCEVSRSTDLFDITSVELTKQPLYMYVQD
jgi:hypothetical protein